MTPPRYYAISLVRGGPRVGLKLWYGPPVDPLTREILTERSSLWRAEINGEYALAEEVAPWIVDGTGDTVRGQSINEEEYNHLSNVAQWAREHDPQAPEAKPRESVDMNRMNPIKW